MNAPPHPAPDRTGGRTPLPPPAARQSLPPDGGPDFNRLIFEQSPYLLQHARNPVDWHPWGDAAFARAQSEQKPIFLSIGYSTCHWCHVMEHESFENDSIADVLNQSFIPVKVDREERPDVDAVYMTYVQAVTGGGGWPMSVWLTPDLKPFMGGTYYPPEDRWGRPGFRSLLLQIASAWATNRAKIVEASQSVIERLRAYATPAPSAPEHLAAQLLTNAFEEIRETYDAQYGGFGGAPKFPRPVAPQFLLRHHARTGDRAALEMTLHTLQCMAEGGMYDQLGGGFHRYAVDARWHVPHFEKMLYDQGQLASLYVDAWLITRAPFHQSVVRGILDYVARDLTAPGGGFYSAEDADSPRPDDASVHAEGAFYVWSHAEMLARLPAPLASLCAHHYDVRPGGNVAQDPHAEFTNLNVLKVTHPMEETARVCGIDPAQAVTGLAEARRLLLAARATRPHPHRDDKIITAWNGLMISGFARAYQAFHDPRDLANAGAAANLLRTRHVDPATGGLLRRSLEGAAGIPAFAEDYAFLIQGLLDLYEADFDPVLLAWAESLQSRMDARFRDAAGGYFRTDGADLSVLVRLQEHYDGAEPTAASVTALNLIRLARMLGRAEYESRAVQTLAAAGTHLTHSPSAMPLMMCALDLHLQPPRQVVIAGTRGAEDTNALAAVVHTAPFAPGRVLLLADGGEGQQLLSRHNPLMRDLRPRGSQATAYLCEHFSCKAPTSDPDTLRALLMPDA